MPSTPKKFSAVEIRSISIVASGADPRTIEKYLRGEHVRGHVAVRIAAALRELGYALPEQQGQP